MPLTSRDKDRQRRQRRVKKLREYKRRYLESKDARQRQALEKKILKHQPSWRPGDEG
jgi:hypothetical protein